MAYRLPACSIHQRRQHAISRTHYLFTVLGWRFYLHQFVGSDPDRGLHDHPWSKAYSVILAGWYREETRSGARTVRWFNSLTGDTFHRVVLPVNVIADWLYPDSSVKTRVPIPCWTLFFHRAGDVKPWGFWRPEPASAFTGEARFEPYTYKREGSKKDWWLTAPTGNELREAVIRRVGDA